MDIKVEITHLQELEAALSKCPGAIKRNLKLAMLVSLRNIQRRARQEHNFRSRSGNLERSIKPEIISEWPLKGRVFLNQTLTKTDDGGSYGVYVHEGTPPHIIVPKDKRCLRWAGGDGFVFSKRVNHPGTKKDPFLYNAGENERDEINNVFERYTLRALKEVGV